MTPLQTYWLFLDEQDKLPALHLCDSGRGRQDAGHGLRAPDQEDSGTDPSG